MMAGKHAWSLNEIDILSLRLFAAAVEEGSLAKTAERENIAISAISRRITDLELRCGVILLNRYDRGVKPTPAGDRLLVHIRKMLENVEQMILDMEDVRGGLRGQIRVHANMCANAGPLPKLVAEFITDHPGIDVHMEEVTSVEVAHAVRTGVADIGVLSGTVEGGDLQLMPWVNDALVVILPPDHALLERETLTLNDVIAEPFIGMQRHSAFLTFYRHRAAAQGLVLTERAHTASFESVRKMVSVGLGIGIVPASAAYPFASEAALGVRPLRESWADRPLMLCLRDVKLASAATRLLLDRLTAHSLAALDVQDDTGCVAATAVTAGTAG